MSHQAGDTRPQLVVLGAGRAARSALPSAVVGTDDHRRVLDWILDAFDAVAADPVHFVGGYRVEEIIERYPQLRVTLNRDWERTGPAASLALVELDAERSLYVSYADILFRSNAIDRMAAVDADVVLAVDTQWRARYDGRAAADLMHAEKVGLVDDRVVAIGRRVSVTDAS